MKRLALIALMVSMCYPDAETHGQQVDLALIKQKLKLLNPESN